MRIYTAKVLEEVLRTVARGGGMWLNEQYPEIAKRAKQEGMEIHWGNGTGLRSDDVRGRGYAPKRQIPVLRINARREGLSIISNVNNKGEMRGKISAAR